MPSQTNAGRNGGGRGKYKQANKQLIDNLREACPPHKLNDLESLVKDLKGDEEKIREKISEWWEEPAQYPTEGEWEDVNPKGTAGKKKDFRQQSRGGGRGEGRGRGRGGREGRGRGNGDRPFPDQKKHEKSGQNKIESQNGRASHGLPPVESVRVPQGAWAKKSEPAVPPVEHVITMDPAGPPTEIDIAPAVISPAPALPVPAPPAPKPAAVGPAGNVWATKGSAHLIRAEKAIPPAPVAPPVSRSAVAPIQRSVAKDPLPAVAHIQKSTPQSPTLEPGAPISVPITVQSISAPPMSVGMETESSPPADSQPILETGTAVSAWNAVASPSEASNEVLEPPQSPVLNKTIGSVPISVPQPVNDVAPPAPPAPLPKPQEQKLTAPTSFINMGHWETDDTDDTNLDFGFGTFDTTTTSAVINNETASAVSDPANASPPVTTEVSSQTAAASASPARPPPGLTIGGGGMPPMPPNAVLVHELENKLEQVSMDANNKQSSSVSEKPMTGMQQQQPSHDMSAPHMAGIHSQNPYNTSSQYAMGMGYNYGAGPAATAVNAFVGMPGAGAPVLGTPQQPPPPKPPQLSGGPLQQAGTGGLYGTPHSGQSTVAVPGTAVSGSSSDTVPASTGGIPPGMPNPAMPYANPPVYYGQQPPFHMGHSQGGIGYNYYGAQFGGVQGFGYPQGMGQSTGYGHGPYHDDQGVGGTLSHQQQASSGGYQSQPKNSSGGYRGGRNAHHNNSNQYQQSHQYNPQQHHQGGYGAQPYSMGYHGDHFGQRGAYGGMQDPYAMQPQQPQGAGNYGGFQGDDQYKGKNKGNRGGGLQHFQQPPQGPPQQLSGGQQGFGLQGQGGSDSNQQSGAGGWSNQHSAGWSGGTSGWQQK